VFFFFNLYLSHLFLFGKSLEILLGWQDSLEVHTLDSYPSNRGLNLGPAIKTVLPMLRRQGDSSMCVPPLGWTLNWESCLPAFVGGR